MIAALQKVGVVFALASCDDGSSSAVYGCLEPSTVKPS